MDSGPREISPEAFSPCLALIVQGGGAMQDDGQKSYQWTSDYSNVKHKICTTVWCGINSCGVSYSCLTELPDCLIPGTLNLAMNLWLPRLQTLKEKAATTILPKLVQFTNAFSLLILITTRCLLFAEDESCYREPQLIQEQRQGDCSVCTPRMRNLWHRPYTRLRSDGGRRIGKLQETEVQKSLSEAVF